MIQTHTPKPPLAMLVALAIAACLVACGGARVDDWSSAPALGGTSLPENVELIAELDRMPSGIAVFGDRVFISLPRWVEAGDFTVAELVDGVPHAYPSAAANELAAGPAALHSVNGIHMDSRGWLWILDNARVDLAPAQADAPKLVVWDTVNEREVFRHVFDPEIAPPASSFLNDIVVDEPHGFAFITESGLGGTPCLIVFEIHRDIATRVLEGHESVLPDPQRTMMIDGEPVMLHRPDGPIVWRVGVNAIAMAEGRVYFGAMTSDSLFSIDDLSLRDAGLDDETRAANVVSIPKPISDGIAADPAGRIYATDVEGERVVLLEGSSEFETVAAHPLFSFPVAIEAAGDGTVWFTTNQLHRMPLLRAGADARVPPYYVWRATVP